MLTLALIDEHVIMRLGLIILLDSHFTRIKILEADDLAHFNQAHAHRKPDFFITGNYHRSKKKSVQAAAEIKKQFPLSRLIVYDYRKIKNLTKAYTGLGVQGHLLRRNIGAELIDCISTVQNNQMYVGSDMNEII